MKATFLSAITAILFSSVAHSKDKQPLCFKQFDELTNALALSDEASQRYGLSNVDYSYHDDLPVLTIGTPSKETTYVTYSLKLTSKKKNTRGVLTKTIYNIQYRHSTNGNICSLEGIVIYH